MEVSYYSVSLETPQRIPYRRVEIIDGNPAHDKIAAHFFHRLDVKHEKERTLRRHAEDRATITPLPPDVVHLTGFDEIMKVPTQSGDVAVVHCNGAITMKGAVRNQLSSIVRFRLPDNVLAYGQKSENEFLVQGILVRRFWTGDNRESSPDVPQTPTLIGS